MNARLLCAAASVALAACASTPEADPPVDEPVIAVAPPVTKPPPPAAKSKPPAPALIEKPGPAVVDMRSSEVEVLLADFARMRRMAAPELARELEAARLAFSQTRSDASRVRLAMIATIPGAGAGAGDEARAIELLDPLVKSPAATLHGLAVLLSAYIQEQRRLAALAQGLQQNVQGLQQSNQTLQQNVHALQQKLDALRTLERALTERGEPAPRRR
jgi:FtsZ-binding cell division protein ZapB